MRITVIGCGNGAFATAADLTIKGHEVTLFADESHKKSFDNVVKSKTIFCSGIGPQGEISINSVTYCIEEAMNKTELIIPVLPANAHEEVARMIAPYIREGMKVFLSPGSTGGALVFAKVFREYGVQNNIPISEVHTLPYTARKVGNTGVNISLITKFMYFSTFPASYNDEMYKIIKELYPNIQKVSDVLETSLNNGNATTHPAPVIMNVGKIEFYGKHAHYREGITPSVGNVVQLIDDERKRICHEFGYDEVDIKERLYKMGYCPLKETVYECIQGSTDVFLPLEGPDDLNGRYLVEDAPCSLVAMIEVARAVGVKTPLMESIVNLACAVKGEDYWKTGRTLEKMGLEGKSKEEILKYLKYGY